MNSKLIKALTAICLALTLIIVFEWFYTMRVQKQLLNSISTTPKQILSDEMPAINLNVQSEASYADLVNRPLFIAGRRPVAESEQTQTSDANGSEWRLSGIYSTPKGLMVLLTRAIATTPADKYRKVTLGADLDGWKVAEIHKDKIILTQGITEKELLLRKPKPKETQEPDNAASRSSHDKQTHGMMRPESEPTSQTEPEPTNNDNNARNP